MNDNAFLKRFGFHRPPRAYFEIRWDVVDTGKGPQVHSAGVCKCCGSIIDVTFRGNPDTMTDQAISQWVLQRTEKLHQCPAVMDTLAAKAHKHFSDIRRGSEKIKEQEFKHKFLGHS